MGAAPRPWGGALHKDVTMAPRAIIACLSLALLATPAWAQKGKSAASSDPVVAHVNGTALHRSEVLDMARNLPPQYQQEPLEKLYPALLNRLVEQTLLAQAGRKAKLAEEAGVKRRIAEAENEVIADAYIDQLLRKEITEKKLRARYQDYVKHAPAREEVEARHILVPTEKEANEIIAQLKKGADFATLAKEKTTDPAGKASGGDLGWFTKDEMVPEFANAAFKLKKGEFTQKPVKTQFGWHIIKVENRRAAKPPSYEQAAPGLAREMSQQIIAEQLKKLRAQGKIEVVASESPRPAPAPRAPAAPAAPLLAPADGVPPAPVLGTPTLAPGTAPDQLNKR
jgi:peptidyl-prolyl cis-trans isomerase C